MKLKNSGEERQREVRQRAHLSYGVLKLGRINALVLLDLPSRGVHLPFLRRTLLREKTRFGERRSGGRRD
jgi:hypothetical protein